MRQSSTLNITDPSTKHAGADISCAKCGHPIGPVGEPWKDKAALHERPIKELGTTFNLKETVLLREFTCPACQTLLDTEIALAGDPFLDDVLFI